MKSIETRSPGRRGRPRSFDRDAALDAAMAVFWEKGYEAASISDLTAAMGINPPSLYAAFGDKEQLFLAAVERYQSARGESCPYCDEPTARAAIERLLQYMARELTEAGHPRGCMMMMAAATAANASPRLQRVLADKRAQARERMRARIRKGVREGDVPPGTDATALADFYATIITGMSQQARDGASRKSLLATAAQAMRLFPATASKPSARRREDVTA
ncbi:MAG TPA: TetR/AcrR family transcriptional regulator [Usitatibacter sp.]|nr:TetR/AcrR family transcriptional regulator [Usitatibacter sp.]